MCFASRVNQVQAVAAGPLELRSEVSRNPSDMGQVCTGAGSDTVDRWGTADSAKQDLVARDANIGTSQGGHGSIVTPMTPITASTLGCSCWAWHAKPAISSSIHYTLCCWLHTVHMECLHVILGIVVMVISQGPAWLCALSSLGTYCSKYT